MKRLRLQRETTVMTEMSSHCPQHKRLPMPECGQEARQYAKKRARIQRRRSVKEGTDKKIMAEPQARFRQIYSYIRLSLFVNQSISSSAS